MKAINKPAAAISALILVTSLGACGGGEAEQLPPVPPETTAADAGNDVDKAAEEAMGAAEKAADVSAASSSEAK